MKASNSFFRGPEFREVLLWCLPALLLGLALRVAMEISVPYGYIQYDSADFLLTPFKLLKDHAYVVHSKKAFLSPTFFSIPFLLHIPALLFIPIAQHLMGLLEVICAGALIRLWFPCWRWIIVPATLLVAACPWQIWYEHTLMGEANYVFFLFLTALTGTLWARRPTLWGFAGFMLSLFLLCGTRAEGKLAVLYAVLLIPLVLWPNWKLIAVAAVCLAAVFFAANRHGGGSHAFSLLYATLFRLTPDDIRSEPGVIPYIIPLRNEVLKNGEYSTDLVELAKEIVNTLERYVHEKEGVRKMVREPIADIEKHLSIEILERRPLAVLMMPLVKFQLASDGWPSGSLSNEEALHARQIQATTRGQLTTPEMSQGLTGQTLDAAGWKTFILSHYDPARIAWFDVFQTGWSKSCVALRLPDRPAEQPRFVHDFLSNIPRAPDYIPGVPLFFLLAFAAMAAAFFIPAPLRWVQAAWIAAMLLTWYGATMVGVTNPRFRFAYEPFCYIYAVAAIVWAVAGVRRLVGRKSGRKTAEENAKVCTAS